MRYFFSDLEFDETRAVLTKCGREVHTRPQATTLLAHLLHHHFRSVSKEEIRKKIWPDTAVGESSFSTLIGELRSAVGDSGNAQRIIRTLPGIGYRFVATLQIRGDENSAPAHLRRDDQLILHEPFVGREGLLAIAEAAARKALDGHPQHLLLRGELGGGKTRLVREIAGMAAAAGFETHAVRADPNAHPPTLWLFVQLLRSIADRRSPEPWSALMASDAPVVRALVRCEFDAFETRAGWPSKQLRFRVTEGIARFLCRVARERPTLLILEDLHWADRISLLALRHSLNLPILVPLWIIATHRPCPPGLIPDRSAEIDTLAGLPDVNRLALPPLSAPAIAALLRAQDLARQTRFSARRLQRNPGGNPLLLWHCLRAEAESYRYGADSHRLQARVAGELGRLPVAARELLIRAAAHRDFPLRPLAQAAGLGETQLRRLLTTLHALGFMQEDRLQPGRLRIRYEPLRRAIADCGDGKGAGPTP